MTGLATIVNEPYVSQISLILTVVDGLSRASSAMMSSIKNRVLDPVSSLLQSNSIIDYLVLSE